jgi:tripartite-type tricarboxylate transporter receptor subunit TctC
MMMRTVLNAFVFSIAVASLPAQAQHFPGRPITTVVPFAAGGVVDIIARVVGAEMSRSLDVPVVIENRVGATGAIAAAYVAKAAPDGYTLLMASNSTIINKWLKPLPYDPEKDFAPIATVGTVAYVLIVSPSLPVNNVAELIAYAKANPKALNYASFGVASLSHLAGELFRLTADADIVHIAYNGSPPALRDVIAGRVQMMFDAMPTALPLVRGKQVKALAVPSLARSPLFPDVPTLDESGLKGFEVAPWYGFVAPAGTPNAVIERLHVAIATALRNPEVIDKLSKSGVIVGSKSPQEFGAAITAESRKWKQVIEKAGIKAD